MSKKSSLRKGAEKRRHPRSPLTLLVQFKYDNFDKFMEAMSRDLSEGGVFIKTAQTRALGSSVFIQVLLSNGAKLLEGMAKVVRVEPNVGMGLEFEALDEHSRAVIADVLAARSAL